MRKKPKKKRNGLFGTSTSGAPKRKGKNRFSMDNLKDETTPVLLVAAGVIAANFAGKTIDGFVKPDNSTVKKAIKPLVLAGAGLALKIMTDNKMLKDFGTGLAIGGVLSGVKMATKQNLLENLSGDLEQLNPDLPDIAGYLESGIDGDLEDIDGGAEEAEIIDGYEYIDGDDDEFSGDDDLEGDDDLSGRKRRRRRALPLANNTPADTETVDFV